MRETRELLSAYLARVATYQGRALLTLVYWGVVSVMALLLRLLGRRLLPDSFGRAGSHWLSRRPSLRDLRALTRQF